MEKSAGSEFGRLRCNDRGFSKDYFFIHIKLNLRIL